MDFEFNLEIEINENFQVAYNLIQYFHSNGT